MRKKLPTWIEPEEFTLLIKNTLKDHHKVSFLLGYGAGMRITEIINLNKDDIDIKSKKIIIRGGKGGKDRIVPLPKGFKEIHLKHIPIKCGVRSLQRAFKLTIQRCGLLDKKPDLTFHSLRHGFATRLVDVGIALNQLQILMGHSRVSTTAVYTHANPKDALNSYEELF